MSFGECGFCTRILEFLKSDYAVGFLAGIVTVLVLWIIAKCVSCFSSPKPFVISNSDETGTFSLSHQALRDFVNKIINRHQTLTLSDVCVKKTKENSDLEIVLKAKADADLSKIREELPVELMDEMKSKLGITDQIGKVNIQISALVTDEQ